MADQLDYLLAVLRERGAEADPPLQGELGTLAATLEALRVLARDGAKRLDRGEMPSPALAIASREWTAAFQTRLAEIISRWGITIPEDYNALTSDLSAMTSIRRRVLQIKREKLGASLLKETG